MNKIRLGRTGLMVSKVGFGALPVQRCNMSDAEKILRAAYDAGINFYDTARAYTDSEEKIGRALSDVRHNIIIATKSGANTKVGVLEHLKTSLKLLKTDYVDIFQLHNPDVYPDKNDPDSIIEGLFEAKKQGLARFIGITNHGLERAKTAALSGDFDTVQFPLSSLSSDADLELIDICKKNDVGVIAMKGMCGGILTNAKSAFAFLNQYDNVVPIWGVQRMNELNEFIELEKTPPELNDEMWAIINADREALAGNFCRACQYCMPCPQGIQIATAARMPLLLRRAVYQHFLTPEQKANMELIDNCTECGACKAKCPYGLDTPRVLKEALIDYREFYKLYSI